MTEPNDPPAQADSPENPDAPDDEPRTRIIRRAPTEPLASAPAAAATTQIIRRAPSSDAMARTTQVPPLPGVLAPEPSFRTAAAASAVSILSGWATSVVATELIAGWWQTDRLFCIAVAFLALVFAITTIAGVIMLLLRRPLGRYLIVTGAVIALLTYCGVFIAGARVAWVVHTLPLLPIGSVALAMLPETKRWLSD